MGLSASTSLSALCALAAYPEHGQSATASPNATVRRTRNSATALIAARCSAPSRCEEVADRPRLLLVVADTANLIADIRVELRLFQWLVCARARPPIGNLFYRSFGGVLHLLFSERIALLAFDVLQLFTL